jgi:prepilin-type processing-associated H-X9-DG protein/prepilin-type N-terminal cleavage/methylation domain-containing protein
MLAGASRYFLQVVEGLVNDCGYGYVGCWWFGPRSCLFFRFNAFAVGPTRITPEAFMVRSSYRVGFTLLEVLVVIGIVSVLVGLLLPAVQKVRETAARIQCQANLKQLALAMHTYHDANHKFPMGVMFPTSADRRTESVFATNYWSWMAQLMPYVEQDNLFRLADTYARRDFGNPTKFSWWPWGDFWTTPQFATAQPNPALGVRLDVLACPTDERALQATYLVGDGLTVAFTSYQGISGMGSGRWDGILYWRSATRIADVGDGLSNTLLIGERPPSADLQYGWWFAGSGWDGYGSGDVVLGASETAAAAFLGCPADKVGLLPGNVQDTCDQLHFWSLHPGGANFALADGSVRFLAFSAKGVLPALCTRGGGEVVNDF